MALLGNYSVILKGLGKFYAGSSVSGNPNTFADSNAVRNRYTHFDKYNAEPVGYLGPYAFIMPQTSGGMGSQSQSFEAISSVGNLAGGRNLEGTSALTITLTNAQLDQIVSAVAAATGTMTKLDAALAAAAGMFADGNGVITLTQAQCGAIFSVLASTSMSITGVGSDVTAKGFMSADAGGPTPLSPEGLATALLNALIADYNEPGSVGEVLNNVGASANPWDAVLTSNTTPGTFGKHVQELLKKTTYIGTK